ncbi:unnamed protein product, partial [Mesorhabditis spiculigera]
MSERVRNRSRKARRDPTTAEDLMAVEPMMDQGSGPPMLFSSSSYDDKDTLLKDQDSNEGWFTRTRESLRGDFSSILLLLFLYLLQGIPLGLISSIPLILSDKKVTYSDQALFSFAYWPFSLKLLWAPIVDSVFWRKVGRRKSWMVPCQYLIGIFMLVLSFMVDDIMGNKENPPKVIFLMLTFLPLNFLAATQDIAVDGWALTMLSRKNVGYASTCNAVGQTAGYFIGNVVFLGLESKQFANMFRDTPQDYGFINLSGFLLFWGVIFIVSTTLVFIFKHEIDHSIQAPDGSTDDDDKEIEMGITDTYKVLYRILRLRPMVYVLIILLTGKIAFAATDGMTGLKLIEMGIPKDKLAMFGLFLTPVQIVLPWIIGKWTTGPRPLNIFLMAYPYRLFIGGVYALLIWWTPSFKLADGTFQIGVYVIWIIAYIFHQFATYSMFVSMMAFNAQVSDPRIGGTYMTLLNTIGNLGGNYPVTLILWIVDHLTWKDCVQVGTEKFLYQCHKKEMADQCVVDGGVCETQIDGYYLGVAICSICGVLWAALLFNKIRYIQKIPRTEWRVIKNR